MSASGTKARAQLGAFEGTKPPHCRRSGFNVGSPLHSRPSPEGCRRSVHVQVSRTPRRGVWAGRVVCRLDRAPDRRALVDAEIVNDDDIANLVVRLQHSDVVLPWLLP
jgi:hypothetical protein